MTETSTSSNNACTYTRHFRSKISPFRHASKVPSSMRNGIGVLIVVTAAVRFSNALFDILGSDKVSLARCGSPGRAFRRPRSHWPRRGELLATIRRRLPTLHTRDGDGFPDAVRPAVLIRGASIH